MIKLGKTTINCIDWSFNNGERILLGCSDGKLREFERPNARNIDTNKTFETTLECKEWEIKQTSNQIGKKIIEVETPLGEIEEKEIDEEKWGPSAITAVKYSKEDKNKIYVTAEGPYSGFVYLISLDKTLPFRFYPGPSQIITFMD